MVTKNKKGVKFSWILVIGILFLTFLTATNWDKINSTDFNLGSYINTIYDSTFVRLANASNEMPDNQAYNSTTMEEYL